MYCRILSKIFSKILPEVHVRVRVQRCTSGSILYLRRYFVLSYFRKYFIPYVYLRTSGILSYLHSYGSIYSISARVCSMYSTTWLHMYCTLPSYLLGHAPVNKISCAKGARVHVRVQLYTYTTVCNLIACIFQIAKNVLSCTPSCTLRRCVQVNSL